MRETTINCVSRNPFNCWQTHSAIPSGKFACEVAVVSRRRDEEKRALGLKFTVYRRRLVSCLKSIPFRITRQSTGSKTLQTVIALQMNFQSNRWFCVSFLFDRRFSCQTGQSAKSSQNQILIFALFSKRKWKKCRRATTIEWIKLDSVIPTVCIHFERPPCVDRFKWCRWTDETPPFGRLINFLRFLCFPLAVGGPLDLFLMNVKILDWTTPHVHSHAIRADFKIIDVKLFNWTKSFTKPSNCNDNVAKY